jgi:NTE family protein
MSRQGLRLLKLPTAGKVSTARRGLSELIDVQYLNAGHPRLTAGAVNVQTGEMRYFDSREATLDIDHIAASGALPPAFPAVSIDGEHYWDGGLYSNTPIEVVLDDNPRRSSLIFSVNVWQPGGTVPESLWQVLGRQKDIQYTSRVKSHIARQKQLHRLRHVIRELTARLPDDQIVDPKVRELTAYGCGTVMHLAAFLAPTFAGEDHTKDVDFSADGIARRRDAGYKTACTVLAEKPWEKPVDPLEGIIIHSVPPAWLGDYEAGKSEALL